MNVIIMCALIAVFLPYLAKVPIIIAANKVGGYDNKQPRAQQSQLSGLGARAVAAHYNCFESLIVFGIAVAIVLSTGTINMTIQGLAIAHIIARCVYCVCYWCDLDLLRSISWTVGVLCPIAMIVMCL
ncbi:membrane protein [Pseudoalteromonas luteoviolacea]|uniref:Membrane protein n=1 Tax=Pseudoalteromonas luteoviolacea TaxID=43657 RepID=A0A0C1MFM4_9GAMM|nr:MAPEG family protein [Pseudoalteromonas luteoviolacea]KID55589.1 membrane protein [Pseudoalteromonas luteoviolacea]